MVLAIFPNHSFKIWVYVVFMATCDLSRLVDCTSRIRITLCAKGVVCDWDPLIVEPRKSLLRSMNQFAIICFIYGTTYIVLLEEVTREWGQSTVVTNWGTWLASIPRWTATFKRSFTGIKGFNVCQNIPHILHHYQRSEPLIQGRMAWFAFSCCLRQIPDQLSECRSRNRQTCNHATFSWSVIVQYLWFLVDQQFFKY